MIKIKDLTLRYENGDKNIIESVSFEVKKGEVVAIMGPSGCGKTTLLSYLQGANSGIIKTNGDVSVDGFYNMRTVFQEPRLLPWKTVFENIQLVAPTKKRLDILSEIDAVGLAGYADKYPDELSLGMQHRVNFLRAYLGETDIILLDEPFSSLDHAAKVSIMADFKQKIRNQGITTIFVTHNKKDAEFLAQRIIYFSPGPAKIIGEASNDKI